MKCFVFVFVACMLPLLVNVSGLSTSEAIRDDTSGSCGANLTWAFNESSSTLTISGTGRMDDYVLSSPSSAPWKSWMTSIKAVRIDQGVESIGNNAFSRAVNITSVAIPDGLNVIGSGAFSFCNQLASITLPSVTTIKENAFSGCDHLTSVVFGNNLTSIGYQSFLDCAKLTNFILPPSLKTIGNNAFANCNSLTSIMIPMNVTSIGELAFARCQNLQSINVDSRNQQFISIDGVLIENSTNTLVQYPAGKKEDDGTYIIPSFITTIKAGAFQGCNNLISVYVPDNVTSIGGHAFQFCNNLTSVNIPSNVKSIEEHTFYGCSSLTSIVIPSSVTSIGTSAFALCTGLTKIVISSSVTSIADNAFGFCKSLAYVSYLGSKNPSSSFCSVFSGISLTFICVLPNYSSSSFCGRNISCKSESCESIQAQINRCYEVLSDGYECIINKTADAIRWEEQNNECFDYGCRNDTGTMVPKKKCLSDEMICVDDKCISEDEMKEWSVVIDIDSSDSNPFNIADLKKEISTLVNKSESVFELSVEYDSDGHVIQVIVYVEDKDTANDIKVAVDNLDKGGSCEGILCESINTSVHRVRDDTRSFPLSGAVRCCACFLFLFASISLFFTF